MSANKANLSIDDLIEHVSGYISNITGVKLGAKQYTLVRSRLSKRMRELGDLNPESYMTFLRNNENSEIAALVSLLTTHHSYFFREFPHFEFLAKNGLQEIVAEAKNQGRKKIMIWSAACSRGQEVYSLSMFLNYHLQLIDPSMEFEIFGSDVSDECVDICKNGVYKWKEIKTIPAVYLGRHWARGTGKISDFVKAKPSIKKNVKFATLNLLDFQKYMGNYKFDIIMCRNVFIYFEQEQIQSIVREFKKYLHNHGQIYLGLSESLVGSELGFEHIGHSIYAQSDYVKSKNIEVVPEFADPHTQPVMPPTEYQPADSTGMMGLKRPIRVMCVDDSPTVLKLLEKIISRNPDFEFVGSAKNGIDASEKLEALKPDVMTLDIHMPEQSGVEYLKENHTDNHIPVVMVSSVSREDANLGIKAFEYGAFDYIEKPSLQTISLLEDELCTKLMSAYEMRDMKTKITDLDVSFKKTPIIANPHTKLRVVYAHVGQRDRLYAVLKQFRAPQPPTVVFFEGIGNLVESVKEEFTQHTVRVDELDDHMLAELDSNRIYFADASEMHDKLKSAQNPKMTSVLMLGKPSQTTMNRALKWNNAHYVAEDLTAVSSAAVNGVRFADLTVPLTSFSYESDKYLSDEEEKSSAA